MAANLRYTDANHSIQILIYIKRSPALSLEEFYQYWETVHGPLCAPWLAKCGLHTSGSILPNDAKDFSPHKTSSASTSKAFDGIALFEVPSLEQFPKAFEDPYFTDVVDPDEYDLIDKKGFQGGLIASYAGNMVSIVDHNKSILGHKGVAAHKKWEEFEKKQSTKTG
ncbi:hypothetical protein EJ08DRAFT_584094 [Tothia fuscella]|uniref:EthD domain-containing protein n=1 Tax=Tothia fuscella TaxID=1048955 RepID=A0A9P4NXV3_9PEZI|nr:hypothetical protein EJ08DRAFT_584094 [Tothia fuscella]